MSLMKPLFRSVRERSILHVPVCYSFYHRCNDSELIELNPSCIGDYQSIYDFIYLPVRFIWQYSHGYDNECQGGFGLNYGYSVIDAGPLGP